MTDNNMMEIRFSTRKISINFKEFEFFTKDNEYEEESHPFDKRLIDAVQEIRKFYDVPLIINSTFRTEEHNKKIKGAKSSFHLLGRAVDFRFGSHNEYHVNQLKKQIKENGTLRKRLDEIGIKGFLFYKTFVHLDTRSKLYIYEF